MWGFLYHILCAYFKMFAKRLVSLFRKYGVSMKRHVLEGICIPLEVRHDLCRRVHIGARGRGHRGCG